MPADGRYVRYSAESLLTSSPAIHAHFPGRDGVATSSLTNEAAGMLVYQPSSDVVLNRP
jgi:hypothetical protein